jgi:protein-S-isoprenylcysteine O-methyltransferase Ste14
VPESILTKMPIIDYVVLAVAWLIWFAPFPLTGWKFGTAAVRDRNARWGMLLQAAAYSVLWQSPFWTHSPGPWRMTLAVVFLALAGTLSWTATRALGRHLRLDAALSADHRLIRSGPYRIIRHPIYASMFCVLLGTGFVITPLPLLLVAIALMATGTEIRARIEDRLLGASFADDFRVYRQQVSSYIPYLR